MKKVNLTTLLVILFLSLLTHISLYSQDILSDTISVDEVVVTGSKTEVSQKLVPVSVSKISKLEIESSGEINILPAISSYIPGVFVTERNILGFGVATGGSGAISIRGIGGSPNTNVLVLIDGHPQYQGIFGHPLPDAYVASDVEKVEVIRGPASILYGSNAMGGAVNIITNQQKKDGLDATIEASYGSYNTQKYCGTIGFKKNKLSVFASLNHDQTDGIRANTDFNITNGYTKLGYQINDHYQLVADFNLAKYDANDNGSIYADPNPFNIDITRGKTSLSFENNHDRFDGALKLYHNFGTHDLSSGWHSTDRNSGAMFYQTLQLFEGNRLTAGIDAKQYGGKGNDGMAKDSLVTIEEVAFYAYMQQSFFQKISLSAGLRVENNSKYGNVLIPMAGINYNPTSTTTLKASVSKGFRSPTVMEMYLYAPNPDLEPEEMINYELSWLQSYLNNNLRTEISLFSAEGDNLIQQEMRTRKNTGSFSNKGVEFALHYMATKKLRINANYSYLDIDKAVLAAPKHQVNLGTNYQYKRLNINISGQHIDWLYTSTIPEVTESYTIFNTRLNVKVTKNINAFVMVNNIFDETYEINYGYPMPGINFSGGIKLKL